jgi:hypothetical protein
MKNIKINYWRYSFIIALIYIANSGCTRELSDDATLATNAKTGDIFTDTPIGMGTNFYFPYGPGPDNPVGSKPNAWTVDQTVSYKGNASMRFDVPNAVDPFGNYAGGIFRVDGTGRDLTGYDALTFWAKASQGATIAEIGFGEDFNTFSGNKYITTMKNVSIGTNWQKYIIPIPDASKLLQERGMLRYAANTVETNGKGYTFWIDELRFEKLGTISKPRPTIANGVNKTINSYNGITIPLTDLKATFNLPSGLNQVVFPAIAYFVFKSTNPNVASVNNKGQITVLGTGTTVITANIGGALDPVTNQFVGGIDSTDSITINSQGVFTLAPTPTLNPNRVLSIFSDAYTNVPVAYYNGFWTPGSTTGSADFNVNGNNILNYTNFNYVGIATSNPTLNCSAMTKVHFDIYIPNSVPTNFDFLMSIEDWGPNQVDNGSPNDDTRQQLFVTRAQVQANTWVSIDRNVTLANRNNIGLIIMENINGSSLSNFYIDNLYFYN